MSIASPSTLEARSSSVPASRAAAAVIGLAVVLTLAAQVRIPLPFTPVPITLQTLVLYIGAAWLGPRLAASGIALYVAAALVGLPVMSGFSGGLAAFTGATGGYVLGWIVAALVLGLLLDGSRPGTGRAAGAMIVASVVILFCGALHLALLLDLSPRAAFLMGVAPFLPGDAIKILVASAAVSRWPNPLALR